MEKQTKQIKTQKTSSWSVNDSANYYGINDWGAGYFDINEDGQVMAKIAKQGKDGRSFKQVAVLDIIKGMQERGMDMPAILRIENLLDDRIHALNEAFARAIALNGYQGYYRGVFPIKVNQQAHVIEEIANFGEDYHHGFEAGSKAELIIALTKLKDNNSLVICNGYKDSEFIDLGLHAIKMDIPCFFVLETLAELPIIIERSKIMGVRPLLGVRIRPSVCVDGHWKQDSGDQSIFGLSSGSLLGVVEMLKQNEMLDCLQLLHCHIGSQVPNIRNIRSGVLEACRYYTGLVEMGAPLGHIDLGGGLAVDYEGSKTNSTHSKNYQLDEYCVNIVETLTSILDAKNIQHPVIITESGRATVAYSSMLLFNILDVRNHRAKNLPATLCDNSHPLLENLWAVKEALNSDNYQECYNDALYYRDEIRALFLRGQTSLSERALADNITLSILEQVAKELETTRRIPTELKNLPTLLSDVYYGNFSLFQSLPDVWAIDQLMPIMPIHRLNEEPERQAVIADMTCDCDGKINQFVTQGNISPTIKLHKIKADEEYYLGVFLIGAYQETLGDLHNLFGDTNVVSVHINDDNSFDFVREFHGDSIADVLEYVEYDTKQMIEQFRRKAEIAVRRGKITPTERRKMMTAFKDSLDGYTYFEG